MLILANQQWLNNKNFKNGCKGTFFKKYAVHILNKTKEIFSHLLVYKQIKLRIKKILGEQSHPKLKY